MRVNLQHVETTCCLVWFVCCCCCSDRFCLVLPGFALKIEYIAHRMKPQAIWTSIWTSIYYTIDNRLYTIINISKVFKRCAYHFRFAYLPRHLHIDRFCFDFANYIFVSMIAKGNRKKNAFESFVCALINSSMQQNNRG